VSEGLVHHNNQLTKLLREFLDCRRIYKLRPGNSEGQTTNTKGKPVMQFKSRIKNLSLAAIIGCAALLSVGPSEAQQPIAPAGTLEVAPATIVEAQPNYVMEQPLPPREIPFRPTMDRSDYDAAKARANFYGPGAAKPFTETFAPLATPVIRLTQF
jgi:hypothetical protein